MTIENNLLNVKDFFSSRMNRVVDHLKSWCNQQNTNCGGPRTKEDQTKE